MGEKWDDPEFKDITELIREDKEQALQSLRQGNFEQKIRSRVAALPIREHGFFEHQMVVPASIAALFLVAAGAVLLFSRRPTTVPQSGPSPMTVILRELPGISDLATPRESLPAGAPHAFGVARAVRTVLALATQQKEEEERKSFVPGSFPKVPHLSLEKKMEILFKEKPIERVLVSILRKSEEV